MNKECRHKGAEWHEVYLCYKHGAKVFVARCIKCTAVSVGWALERSGGCKHCAVGEQVAQALDSPMCDIIRDHAVPA